MQLSQINDLLRNLSNPDKTKLKFIRKDSIHEISEDSYGNYTQGDEGEYDNIYQVIGEDNLYLKINYTTDSYGHNDTVRGVQFVKAKEITVSSFEKA